MFNLKKKLKEKKGFTLAELLIVVAIIAVLVAISIPIFTSQLEKSRDAVTAANLRAAYAEAAAEVITNEASNASDDIESSEYTVEVKGTQSNGGLTGMDFPFTFATGAAEKLDNKATYTTFKVTFTWTWDDTKKELASEPEVDVTAS
ncbi:MAG: prepilin-type N-terminal cleavage/methylation domain-containing protein [Lachnospiraceae bacterium]|nr:prepilin-type N-terminal cleavage/methylation domain-containing protein [Lachnospiraceae bacterium]